MNTEKVIQADIDCLLNTIGKATAAGNLARAFEAMAALKERMEDLKRVGQLKEASRVDQDRTD